MSIYRKIFNRCKISDNFRNTPHNESNYINGRGIDSFDIGSKIEALQKSAMEYAQAKGVGEQYSKRGQARMYAALDMCDEMSEYMGIYASKERMKDIQNFEKGLTEKTINKEEKNEMNKEEDELNSFEK